MSDRIPLFAYGLYMDVEWLEAQGLQPADPQQARVTGFDIHLGEKSTLLPNSEMSVWGMVIQLTDEEIGRLYEPLPMYRPENVTALINEEPTRAICYNIPPEQVILSEPPDKEYAQKLIALLERLEFDEAYISRVKAKSSKSGALDPGVH